MIRVLPDPQAASRAAADEVVNRAVGAVRARGRFTVALAGGHTPRRAYELLATEYRDRVPWDRVHVFWGDERCVPPDDDRSNYAMARDALLRHVPLADGAVHRIPGERGPEAAAAAYRDTLAAALGRGEPPAGDDPDPTGLDLVVLGAGTDGHTASLFPGQLEPDDERWARGVRAPAGVEPPERVTLTLRALNASGRALFLVLGEEKREVVSAVREAEARAPAPGDPPAAHVRPPGGALWIVDRAAGGE